MEGGVAAAAMVHPRLGIHFPLAFVAVEVVGMVEVCIVPQWQWVLVRLMLVGRRQENTIAAQHEIANAAFVEDPAVYDIATATTDALPYHFRIPI